MALVMTHRFHHVAVLMGGASTERDISLSSGRAALAALREAGYGAEPVVLDERNRFELPAGAEAAFLALHGAYGEDGGVQAELEARGVPYTGSGVESSRVSFDKVLSRAAFERAGVPVPAGYVLGPGVEEAAPRIAYPLVVKPPRQGSSVGVSIVRRASEWAPALALSRRYDPDVVVERYIPGREWTVPIVGEGTALPVVEIRPKVDWYDWRAKYADDAGTDYVFPEDDPANAELAARTREIALRAYRALGGRGMGRIDLRVAPDGGIFALENNSIPGLTSHSLLPKAAAKAGIPFPELCSRILEDARCG